MFEYRVTKYDPALRDPQGAYTRDEWISVSDIGRSFDGVVLTEANYRWVEDAYAAAAVGFLREAGVTSMAVTGLEPVPGAAPPRFANGAVLGLAALDEVVRQMLREELWCWLEGADAFVHVGYDYYMYLGVPVPCPRAAELAEKSGLFVEPFESPYHK